MTRRLSEFLKIGVVLGIAVILAACGGGGSAAPSAGGGTPVAVEIPALSEVGDLPFASGIVVSGSSNVAASLKATKSSWVYKTFTLDDNDVFTTGNSDLACEYRNSAGILIGTWSLPDETLCMIQDSAASFTSPYDGNYHILGTGVSMAGFPAKIKFKVTRNSRDEITGYESFACDSTNTQMTYVSYTIAGSDLTATFKEIRDAEPQRTTVDIVGTLSTSDTTQYTAKSGTVIYTGTGGGGALEGKIIARQGTDYLLQDAFDSRGAGSNITQIYGQADMSNTTSPLTLRGYTFSATATTPGAANFIDNGTSSSGCWDVNNDPTTCLGSNYDAVNGNTPMAASTQTVSDFSGSQAWDCSGTVEVTSTFTSGSGSCIDRFSLDSNYIDCTTATQGYLTVTPSVSGTTLSTTSGSPTSVSATPTILLTASRALDTSSTNSTTVTLVNNSTNDSVSLTYTSYNSEKTILTLSPTLTSGQTYKLTLVGSSTVADTGAVIRSPDAEPPADQLQSTGTYYITVP